MPVADALGMNPKCRIPLISIAACAGMPYGMAEATRLLGVREVIPMHYGITPGSEVTPAAYRAALDAAGLGAVRTFVMASGQTVSWDRTAGIRAYPGV